MMFQPRSGRFGSPAQASQYPHRYGKSAPASAWRPVKCGGRHTDDVSGIPSAQRLANSARVTAKQPLQKRCPTTTPLLLPRSVVVCGRNERPRKGGRRAPRNTRLAASDQGRCESTSGLEREHATAEYRTVPQMSAGAHEFANVP